MIRRRYRAGEDAQTPRQARRVRRQSEKAIAANAQRWSELDPVDYQAFADLARETAVAYGDLALVAGLLGREPERYRVAEQRYLWLADEYTSHARARHVARADEMEVR